MALRYLPKQERKKEGKIQRREGNKGEGRKHSNEREGTKGVKKVQADWNGQPTKTPMNHHQKNERRGEERECRPTWPTDHPRKT